MRHARKISATPVVVVVEAVELRSNGTDECIDPHTSFHEFS